MSPRTDRLGFRFLIFVAVGLILAALFAIALAIWWLRSEAIRDASRNAGNLAFVLAEQTNRSAQSIELVLNDLRERINVSSTSSGQDLRRLLQSDDTHQMLTERLARLSHISFISIVDKEGWIVNSTNQWPLRPTNVADRAHFQYVKKHNEPGIYISDPIYDRLKGIQTLLFIKRINDANNEFLGTVVVGVGLSYFQHIYEALSKLHDLSFFLLRADGTVLVRYPDAANLIGEKIPPFSPWYGLVNEGGGYYRSPGYFDGVARQIAVRRLTDYPLAINVAVSEGAALAAWRIQAMSIGGGSLLIISCLIFLLQALNRQFKRLAVSESSLVQKARELEQSNAKVEVALNNMSQGLAMFDGEGRLVVCNKRYTEVYDLPAELARPGTRQEDILHNRIGKGIYACGDPERYFDERVTTARAGKRKDCILELSNGRSLFVCHQPTAGGGWVSTHEDITERQRAEAKINHMARHDALTDLPNRLFLREQLEQSLKRVHRGERVAVLYLDLDQFKAINDTLGHSVGDVLLEAVAVRLRACLRDTDVVGRLGGDEFAIIQNAVRDEKDITNLVNRLFDAVRTQYDLDGRQLNINTSIGVSVAPTDGCDPDQLLRNADLAMYRAKADGRGTCRFFEPEMERRVKARLKLEFELRQAIMGEEFELYYQPLLSLRQNRVSGCEALLRWHHPTRGLISPAEFIALAEETGLIAVLGEWVLKAACAVAASWPDDVKVAVNVSPVQFKDRNFVQTVVNTLKATGLPGRKLVLEITEAVLLDADEAVLIALHRLRELGIQIALDDFGTGYSSLGYLRRFPFDKIKIDRFFIKDVPDNESSRSIIEAVVNIANSANITTVAEGVETEQQLKALRKLGCTEIQGYLFSAPLTAPKILPLLHQALPERKAAVA